MRLYAAKTYKHFYRYSRLTAKRVEDLRDYSSQFEDDTAGGLCARQGGRRRNAEYRPKTLSGFCSLSTISVVLGNNPNAPFRTDNTAQTLTDHAGFSMA